MTLELVATPRLSAEPGRGFIGVSAREARTTTSPAGRLGGFHLGPDAVSQPLRFWRQRREPLPACQHVRRRVERGILPQLPRQPLPGRPVGCRRLAVRRDAGRHFRTQQVVQEPVGELLAAAFTQDRGAVGIERIFPLMSPWIKKLEVKKLGEVRRAKLYYLRGKQGREATRINESDVQPTVG